VLKKLLNAALALISQECANDSKYKYDVNLVRVTRDQQTMHPRVEATDLKRVIRVESNSRSEGEEFFIDHRILDSLQSADNITHEKQVLTATTGEECVMIETKATANWPDFDKVLPKKITTHRLNLNGQLLIELLTAIMAFKVDPNDMISLEIHHGDLVVKASGKEVSVIAMQSRMLDDEKSS
jgi:hypothetical protein